MSSFVQTRVANGTGIITLDRPRALNSLSLQMVRELDAVLRACTNVRNPGPIKRAMGREG